MQMNNNSYKRPAAVEYEQQIKTQFWSIIALHLKFCLGKQ